MTNKKYWNDLKTLLEAKIKKQPDELNNLLGAHVQENAMLKLCDDKIAEFPDDDPMPEELKEIAEELKKDG